MHFSWNRFNETYTIVQQIINNILLGKRCTILEMILELLNERIFSFIIEL